MSKYIELDAGVAEVIRQILAVDLTRERLTEASKQKIRICISEIDDAERKLGSKGKYSIVER